ncbi:MAG: Holliday junction resolvase RuvX [Myxococcota bacterium]
MRSLGLDVGSKTIGRALGDASGLIATAYDVWARKGHVEDAREIVRQVSEEAVQAIVVGLPLELDGRVGRRARATHRFVEALEAELAGQKVEASVHLWDERFSTAAAERAMIAADVSRARRKEKIDAVAAQVILQGWLDAQRNKAQAGGAS